MLVLNYKVQENQVYCQLFKGILVPLLTYFIISMIEASFQSLLPLVRQCLSLKLYILPLNNYFLKENRNEPKEPRPIFPVIRYLSSRINEERSGLFSPSGERVCAAFISIANQKIFNLIIKQCLILLNLYLIDQLGPY